MTRLYTSDFRCGVCFRISTTGWVYRCTQDREFLIEDDVERGEVEKMDALCDLFPPSSSPRKRGPAARSSRLSFLDEVSDSALKTYAPAQLGIILNQRAHVLDVANESFPSLEDEKYYFNYTDQTTSSLLLPQTLSPPQPPTNLTKKPWLPAKGTECQFKCCHLCRPTLTERSFLSLNGIANNDIPATAIYGFGFHLQNKKRPIALAKHVKNLGLRPSPPPRPGSSAITPAQERFLYLVSQEAALGLGLDIGTPERPLLALPMIVHEDHPLPTITQANLAIAQVSHITAQSRHLTNNPYTNPYTSPARSILQRRLDHANSNVAHLTPLPDQTDDEVVGLETSEVGMSEMEMSEVEGGFGREALEVSGGVAVTEEAVGLHVADLITQV